MNSSSSWLVVLLVALRRSSRLAVASWLTADLSQLNPSASKRSSAPWGGPRETGRSTRGFHQWMHHPSNGCCKDLCRYMVICCVFGATTAATTATTTISDVLLPVQGRGFSQFDHAQAHYLEGDEVDPPAPLLGLCQI